MIAIVLLISCWCVVGGCRGGPQVVPRVVAKVSLFRCLCVVGGCQVLLGYCFSKC